MLKSKTAGSIEEDSVQDNSKNTQNRGKSNNTVYISNVISSGMEDLKLKWVVVQHCKENNAKKLIGQVIEAVDSNITVKLLKQTVPEKYGWPHSR